MHSCLYEGRTAHRRFSPVEHQFKYQLFLLYLDLAELPELARRGILSLAPSWRSRALLASDHLPIVTAPPTLSPKSAADSAMQDSPSKLSSRVSNAPPVDYSSAGQEIDRFIRSLVEQRTGTRPRGAIRMLTQLRYFGYYFSPINLYYCFDAAGEQVETVVAEVNNIPWRERHHYVLWNGNRTGRGLKFSNEKEFHVSPFMPMQQQYRWYLNAPGERLTVHLANFSSPVPASDQPAEFGDISREKPLFDATLALRRTELSLARLRSLERQHVWMPAKVVAAIYFEALRLWTKKCPSYSHPATLRKIAPVIDTLAVSMPNVDTPRA